jgi:hypothetical protein
LGCLGRGGAEELIMGGACSCWTRLEERAARGGGGAAPPPPPVLVVVVVVVPKQLSLKHTTTRVR